MENQVLGIGSRIKHPEFGMGVIIQIKVDTYLVTFVEHGVKEILKSFGGFEVIELVEAPEDLISFQEMEERLIKIFRKYADIQEVVPISDKWKGGKMVFYPPDPTRKEKEMLIDTFFHKIVMVRDRLRVMEQRINASKLDEEDKYNLQQYITRIYGSLTSFNIFFKNKEDMFTGTGGD